MLLYVYHRTTCRWVMLQGVISQEHATEIVERIGREKRYRLYYSSAVGEYEWNGRIWEPKDDILTFLR